MSWVGEGSSSLEFGFAPTFGPAFLSIADLNVSQPGGVDLTGEALPLNAWGLTPDFVFFENSPGGCASGSLACGRYGTAQDRIEADALGLIGRTPIERGRALLGARQMLSFAPTTGGGIPPGGMVPTGVSSGGGFLGTLGDILGSIGSQVAMNLPTVLNTLSDAGVIRGSVGEFFNPQPMNSMSSMTPAGMTPVTTVDPFAAALQMRVASDPAFAASFGAQLQARANVDPAFRLQLGQSVASQLGGSMNMFAPVLAGGLGGLIGQLPSAGTILGGASLATDLLGGIGSLFGGGGMGMGVVDAPQLFRMRPQGTFLPSRIQVRGPDGRIYVLANLGRATRGSRESSVARSLARANGLSVTKGRSRRRFR